MSELLDASGNEIKSIKTMKASERTRTHLNSPATINRTFDSDEAMLKSAEEIYGKAIDEREIEYEKEKALGFDINDIESVMRYPVNFTPLGNTVLVKFIYEKENKGKIILPSAIQDTMGRKAIVIVPGLFVDSLRKGDLILFRPMENRYKAGTPDYNALPPAADKMFGGIKFHEISFEAVAGVFISREEIIKRLAK